MNVLGVIPSRFGATRLPGKPLELIGDKSVIQRVYEQCVVAELFDKVIVATDDDRIFSHVKSFNGEVMMTGEYHESGTQRCGEVLMNLEDVGEEYDVIVNIQGDEPFINPKQLEIVLSVFDEDPEAEVVTLAKKITSLDELLAPHTVKVVMTDLEEDEIARDALYFSRQPIPYLRGVDQKDWLTKETYYKHIGVYAFSVEEFHQIIQLEPSPLEAAEGLEQLRWVANHFTIQVAETDLETIGIDTPEDLERARKLIEQD